LLDEHDASLTLTTLASTAAIFGTDAQSWVNLQTHYDTGQIHVFCLFGSIKKFTILA
jgi:plasmid maintenance system antidote protein VapI